MPTTRWLHFAGTLGGTIGLFVLIATGHPRYLPLIFLYSYGLAWIGHFFVERNRPATFKYPLWSFLADYKMCALMLAGKMGPELSHVYSLRKNP